MMGIRIAAGVSAIVLAVIAVPSVARDQGNLSPEDKARIEEQRHTIPFDRRHPGRPGGGAELGSAMVEAPKRPRGWQPNVLRDDICLMGVACKGGHH
jgi:hypothetical protein